VAGRGPAGVPPVPGDSDTLDSDGIRMRSERSEVPDVATEHHAARLGTGYHDSVHSRTPSGEVSELTRATGKRRRQILADITSLEEPVHRCVSMLTPGCHFSEHDGRDERRPVSVADERTDGGHHVLVPLGEKADPAGVQDKHDQLALGACVLSCRNRPASSSALATDAGEGSPTSSTSSARYRSASSRSSRRRISSRTAPWRSSEAGSCRSLTARYSSSGRYTCKRGMRLNIRLPDNCGKSAPITRPRSPV
jgi:hypothetical protein